MPIPSIYKESTMPFDNDLHYLEAMDADDNYLALFGDRAFLVISRFKAPAKTVALKRGWSPLVGNSATPAHPRGGAPWTEAETKDLLVAAAGKINLTKLAKIHGRTETAISCRLEAMGVDKGVIAASDFEPVLDPTPHPSHNQPKPRLQATTPESRVRSLMSVAMGFSNMEHVRKLPPADITFLVMDDLIDFDPAGEVPPSLTAKGRQLVDSLVGRSTGRKKADVVWNQARETSELTEGVFFMVTSGDVYKDGSRVGKPAIKRAPKVVQSHQDQAESEALRLATENPGERFFVLEAKSVHQVGQVVVPQPVSKRV
ncbi:hypothetical protein [Stenotrophomonas phage A1432]|uniref:Uncharacterized protein n=1 Tax=Stenotrophomonas phage A1432 TaxID=2930315 RepID=A0A9E7N342_9CAUD|nr:hypothetical protein P9A45_gp69 [Stenotrophomonas phage A1432]UTC27961.1 hypothetical protein [Stenotrophomonas phage A1432]